MRVFRSAILSLLCLQAAAPAHAQDEPALVVEAGSAELFIGESLEYVVELRNVRTPKAPDVSAIRKDFEVLATGDQSRNQSSTFIVNGRISQQNSFGHVYQFRLTPKRTGVLEIPGPTATVDGQTLRGRTLSVRVVAPEAQDVVIPEIKLDRARVYPTQPFEVTLRVLVRPLPDDPDEDPLVPLRPRPPHLEVNWVDLPSGLSGEEKAHWLEKMLARNAVGFTLNDITMRGSMFSLFEGPQSAVFSLDRGREHRKGKDGEDVHYFVYELKRTITADRAGTYGLGPALVKGNFVAGQEDGRYTGRRLVAVAPALSVEVRDVPEPRPATYCGGIGDYRLAATANPKSLRVGDPLTLTLEISREPNSGSLDLISAPDLTANAQLAESFEVVDRSPTGTKSGEVKRFEYALRPKRPGAGIPALGVTFFNPETEKFSEVSSQPIALDITTASQMNAGEIVGATPSAATTQIRSQDHGIFQNVTDPTELRDQRVNLGLLGALAAGLWTAVGCVFVVVSTQRRRSGDVVWQRRRQARRAAVRRLAEARKALAAGQTRDALREARSALVGLVADMRAIVGEGLTATEVDRALTDTAVPTAERSALRSLLETLESAQYGAGGTAEAAAWLDQAEALIPGLARHLQRRA